ncbi:hypothetical protein GCM10022381_28120 [Leifsonia kafniensis]|uniref:Htaa domain-containing protein n=1 Tax=Leifsonia kafniensis TaxID=475957 RepID=A0ABP7KQE7_9MICO
MTNDDLAGTTMDAAPVDATTTDAAPVDGAPELAPGLTWGLKRSFIRYLSSLPDGAHALGEGASLAYSSIFHFELGDGSTYDPSTGRGVLKFRGQVQLSGHYNMMFVLIADPWVEFTDDGVVLTVVDSLTWPDRQQRIVLAELDRVEPETAPAGLLWQDVPARLSARGVFVFNEQYGQGEEMDPVFILLP